MPTPSEHVTQIPPHAECPETISSTYTSCPTDESTLFRPLNREEIESMLAQHERDSVDDLLEQSEERLEEASTEATTTRPTGHVRAIRRRESRDSAHIAVRPTDDGSDANLIRRSRSTDVVKKSDPPRAPLESISDCQSRDAAPPFITDAASFSPPPQYLHFPQLERGRCSRLTTSLLRSGSKFIGTQTSDRQRYEVQVEIKDVDLAESFLCGYLRIQGLTDDHPTLTTFFEGEIIGPKYKFKTTHPTWGSSEKIDMTHWACFPEWRKLAKSQRSPNFTAPDYLQHEQLYMRWKEYFLVPDHRVKTITGASFEGFYYISFNQCSGTVDGVYFHAKSEKWQQLRLEHVEDRGCMPAVEFR